MGEIVCGSCQTKIETKLQLHQLLIYEPMKPLEKRYFCNASCLRSWVLRLP